MRLKIIFFFLAIGAIFFGFTNGANAVPSPVPCSGPYNINPPLQFYCPSAQIPLGNNATYNYNCEETTTNRLFCRDYQNPLTNYYDCGSTTGANPVNVGNGWWFNSCVLVGDNISPSYPNQSAVAVSNSRIDISWDYSTDNVAVKEYRVYFGLWQPGLSVIIPHTGNVSYSYSFTGLGGGATYWYEVVACDTSNNCITKKFYSIVTSTDSTPPSDPTSLTATAQTSSQINLSWTASSDPESGIQYYEVQYCSGSSSCSPSLSISPNPTTNSASHTGLSPSAWYGYRVRALNGAGLYGNWTSVVYAQTLAPPDTTAPAQIINLAASNPTSNSMLLSWTAPGDDGNTGTASVYDLRYSTAQITNANWGSATPAIGEPAPAAAGTSQSMTVGGLSPGTLYYFAIVARDEVGNQSSLSSNASATTSAVPTVSLISSASIIILDQSVTLSWSSTNAVSCNGFPWTSSTAVSGSQSVTPSATTVYSITCTGPGGSATQSVTVTVTIPAAPTVSLNASPSSILTSQSSTLSWSSTNAVSCNGFPWTSSTAVSGSQPVTPSATTVYSITCTGPGGSATQSATVTVTVPAAPTVTLTASPSSSINAGSSVTLSWSTTGAVSCSASGGWSGAKSVPNGSETLTPLVTADYILTCVNSVGVSVSQQITVTVTDLPPVISSGAPTGQLPANTILVTMSVRTNEPAYCSYNLNTDTTFANMEAVNGIMLSDLAQQYHSAVISAANGVSYVYYVRCQDTPVANENTSGYPISFSVAMPPNVLPAANMTAGPISGDAPLVVTVDGSASYDTDGTIAQYTWQWGDGTPDTTGATAFTASHTYTTVGTYILTLTVRDNQGGTGMASRTITVTAPIIAPPPPPASSFCAATCTSDANCTALGLNMICAPNGICALPAGFCVPGATGVCSNNTDCPSTGICPAPLIQNSYFTLPATNATSSSPANFPAGTTALIMTVETDVKAQCRYSTTPSDDVNFYNNTEFMRDFTYSGATSSSVALTVPKNITATSTTYNYYIRCKDLQTGDTNTADYPMSFTIGAQTLVSGPDNYVCWINQNFIKTGIPYLFDVCRKE